MSAEQQPIAEQKWWTIDAPFNIVRRRELVEQGDSAALADVDEYIAYINEDMESDYVVKSAIYQKDGWEINDDVEEKSTKVYLQHADGEFDLLGTTGIGGAFYGHKIELLDEQPILVYHHVIDGELTRLGISLHGPTKLVSIEKLNRNGHYITTMFRRLRWLNNG